MTKPNCTRQADLLPKTGPASGEIIITAGTTGGYNIHAANLITEHARMMLADRLAELLISAG